MHTLRILGWPSRTTAVRSRPTSGRPSWYRLAQRAVDHRVATAALRLAVKSDPAFGLAVADLDAITGSTHRSHQPPPDELGTPPHRSGQHCGSRKLRLEPPTCSENTSPASAATHSLCASSSTFDGPPDAGTSSRTSPAIFPAATRLGRRYRRCRNDRASAPANRADIIISERKGPVHARSDRRPDRCAPGAHVGIAEREPSNGTWWHGSRPGHSKERRSSCGRHL